MGALTYNTHATAGSRRHLGGFMIRRSWVAVILFSAPGCGLNGFEESSRLDPEEIQSLIDSAPYPEMTPAASAVQPSKVTVKPDGTRSIEIDLVEALRLSLSNNQGWLGRTEGMDLQLLSLQVLHRQWWPVYSPISGSVSWGDSKGSDPSSSEGLSFSLSQKLPWGGASASVSGSTSGSQGSGPNSYSSSYSAAIGFPLLRGAGWRLGVEDIVSAERGYAYARRSFEYARTDLLIQTVQSYFGQLKQNVNIANLERSLERAKRGAEMATLQFGRGIVRRTDVFREELAVNSAENALINARESARLALDVFKIDLGLRPEDELILLPEKLEYKSIAIPLDEAIKAAFATNPGWLNSKDAFDDAGRGLDRAYNATLPSVGLSASYSWAPAASDRPFEDFDTASRGVGVGLSFSLDLDRASINLAYQSAVIGYRQAERGFQRARDEMTRNTQSQVISLRQAEITMANQDRSRTDAKKALELAEDEYDRGLTDNLALIQLREQLVAAENAYEDQLLAAKVTQLKLLQWMGRLQPDEEGRWFR